MIDIAILRAMAAAGAPVDAILAAIEADQMAEIARVQARRIADAERQRRKRHADTVGHAVTPRDTVDANRVLSSSLLSLQTSEIKKENKKERGQRGKHRLPNDWAPKEAHYLKGERGFVDRKAEDMRNWAKSKGVMRIDWDATFYGFLRPSEHKNGAVNGSGHAVMDAFDSLIDQAGSGAVGTDAPMRDITPRGS